MKVVEFCRKIISSPIAPWVLVLAGLVASIALYAPVLDDPLYNDDINLLHNGSRFRAEWLSPFSRPEMFYRPVWEAHFTLAYKLFGLHPTPYHLVSLILHLVNCILLFTLARHVLGTPFAAVSAVLFAVYPKATEAVHWISSVNTLMAAFFMLVTVLLFLTYLKKKNVGYLIFSYITFALALLSKETAVTLPAMLVLADEYCYRKATNLKEISRIKENWKVYVPYGLLWLAFVMIYVLRISLHWQVTSGVYALNWHVFPRFYEFATDTFVNSTQWYAAIITAIIVFYALFKGNRGWKFGILWFVFAVIPFLPQQNVGVFERFNYIPAIGFIILVFAMIESSVLYLKRTRLSWARCLLIILVVVGLVVSLVNAQNRISRRQKKYVAFFEEVSAIESGLGELRENEKIHIDTDIYAPYVEQYLELKRGLTDITVTTNYGGE